MWKRKKKSEETKSNLPAKVFKFIQVDKECTIIIGSNTYIQSVDELKKYEVYDSIVKGIIDPTELEKIILENQEVKNDNVVSKQLVKAVEENLEYKDGKYYRHPFPVSLPKQLVTAYGNSELTSDRIKALDWFWFWCNLNPDQTAARDLFNFLKVNGLLITQNGFILGYRNVNIKSEGNRMLHDFITTQHAKIKSQKAAPKNYVVIDNSEKDTVMYSLWNTKNKTELDKTTKLVGTNLEELYDNVSDFTGTVFTDGHTGKFVIKIGELVVEDRAVCDSNPLQTCSRGLHMTSYDGLSGHYALGTHSIACLINPMDIVAVPGDYGGRKMRCCRYLPISTISAPLHEGDMDVINFDAEMLSFSKEELRILGQKVKNTEDVSPIKLLKVGDVKKMQMEVPKILKKRRKVVTIR